jgi:hypothetical protein
MFTVMAEEELITVSGNVNGFALIGTPLIDVTLTVEGGDVGNSSAKGTERSGEGSAVPEKVLEFASSRIRPGLPATL